MVKMVIRPDPRWRNRAVIRERDDRKARWMWLAVIGMFLATAPIGICTWQQNECLKLSYAVEALRAEHDRLLETERQLKIDRAAGESFSDIESWATRRHGLARPTSEEVMVLRHQLPAQDVIIARGPAHKD